MAGTALFDLLCHGLWQGACIMASDPQAGFPPAFFGGSRALLLFGTSHPHDGVGGGHHEITQDQGNPPCGDGQGASFP